MMGKRYFKDSLYRITESDSGITSVRNYKYLGLDKYGQKVFRPVGSKDDIALRDNMGIIDLKTRLKRKR